MINIEYIEELKEEYYKKIDAEFDKLAIKNNMKCDYKRFSFMAKDDDKFIGLITGHSYYKEVNIEDLIILEEYRSKHIGSMLVKTVEEYFENKDFENINLTTYGFQAPEFYKKCGYEIEFIRKNKNNPKLDKYFLIKYI